MTETGAVGSTPASSQPGSPPDDSSSIDPRRRFGAAAPGAAPVVALPSWEDDDTTSSSRRRWVWPVVGVVVLAALAGAFLGGRASAPGRGPVVATLTRGVAAGAPVTAADVAMVHVSSPPPAALRAQAAAVGHTSLHGLPAGAVLVRSDVGPAVAFPTAGQALVGVSVKPGQAPADGLQPGDSVVVVEQPPSQNGKAVRAVVLDAAATVAASEPVNGGESVTLVVPLKLSVAVAAQASTGDLSLIALPTR